MKTVTVLVDWQNLYKTASQLGISSEKAMEAIEQMIRERGRKDEVRLFVPNFQSSAGIWRMLNSLQLKFGAAIEVCPVLREGDAETDEFIKDMVDFGVLLWVLKHPPDSDIVAFVTGDGHFTAVANEVKGWGNEVEFWILDESNTSKVIFRHFAHHPIRIANGVTVLAGTTGNTYLTALDKFLGRKGFGKEEKEKILQLIKAEETIAGLNQNLTIESRIAELKDRIVEKVNISRKEAQEIIELLLALGAVRIYPVSTFGVSVDDSASLRKRLAGIVE